MLFDWSGFQWHEVEEQIVDGAKDSILHSASIISMQHYSMDSNK